MSARRQPLQSGFAGIAEALADPAREAIVSALADGKAMPAGELATIAGISPQSASAHLQKLVDAGVLQVWSQGRFRYYRIADDDMASLVESLVNLAVKADRRRALPCEPLRQSRTCYSHLAGQLGVLLGEVLIRRRLVRIDGRIGHVTAQGLEWCEAEKIEFSPMRAPHFRLCNDWTERVPHLAGAFPNAVMRRLVEAKCVAPRQIPRALRLTGKGRAFFERLGAKIPF
jgi:DNA-binding transcriptional ArsR family regulator